MSASGPEQGASSGDAARLRGSRDGRAAAFVGAAVALASLGCAARVEPLTVRSVDWNPAAVDVGEVVAVAELGPRVVTFGARGVHVFTSGALTSHDESILEWTPVGASVVPAPDAEGAWIVAVDRDGDVHRVKDDGSIEDVTARFGLRGGARRALAIGAARTAFELRFGAPAMSPAGRNGTVAVSERGRSEVLDVIHWGGWAAGPDRMAWVTGGCVTEVVGAELAPRGLVCDDGTPIVIAIDGGGRLWGGDWLSVFGEDARGRLRPVYSRAAPGRVWIEVAASGERVWFSDDGTLGVVEGGRVFLEERAPVTKPLLVVGASGGDVWTLDASGSLGRFAVGERAR